nr:GTPase [Staphylococcus pettenkoferi]
MGRGNVGKCRLVKGVIGDKIGIMSDKRETRGNKIEGVMREEDGEIIFLETGGIQKGKDKLAD